MAGTIVPVAARPPCRRRPPSRGRSPWQEPRLLVAGSAGFSQPSHESWMQASLSSQSRGMPRLASAGAVAGLVAVAHVAVGARAADRLVPASRGAAVAVERIAVVAVFLHVDVAIAANRPDLVS